jgi:predicted Zn finger-like uncharacterized protein
MLIICPDCATSYEVDTADLGPSGRKVRCTSCGSIWRAAPPEASPEDIDSGEDAHEAEPMFGIDDMAGSKPIAFNAMIGEEDGAEEAETIEDMDDLDEIEEIAATEPKAKKSRRKPRGTAPRSSGGRSLTYAAVLGLMLLASSVVWRDKVVSTFPDLAGLYAMAGLPVNLRGLEFKDMETVETTDDGIPQLIVRGTIENVTGDKVTVPRLRLAVRGLSGREIFVWTAVPAKPELAAGESLPFLAQLASPPAEGREIAVRFVSNRDGLQTAAVR